MSEQEGFFRPITRQSAPSAPSVPAPPVAFECRVTITYVPERPDLPAARFDGDACFAGAEIALAVALATLLKSSVVAIPVPKDGD